MSDTPTPSGWTTNDLGEFVEWEHVGGSWRVKSPPVPAAGNTPDAVEAFIALPNGSDFPVTVPAAGTIPAEGALTFNERCEDCARTYSIWYADSDLWNAVMRLPDGTEPVGMVCARCFLIRAHPVTEFARVTWPETPSKRDQERGRDEQITITNGDTSWSMTAAEWIQAAEAPPSLPADLRAAVERLIFAAEGVRDKHSPRCITQYGGGEECDCGRSAIAEATVTVRQHMAEVQP